MKCVEGLGRYKCHLSKLVFYKSIKEVIFSIYTTYFHEKEENFS